MDFPGDLERAVAQRLRAVMEMCDIRRYRQLGDLCGTTASAVNNWLGGSNLPRVPEMTRLCDQTGITLDWLYRGSMATMDPTMGIELAAILKRLSDGTGA